MAVLQKIRERSGLLVGVIGFCILAFVAGDLLSGGISVGSRNVGEVNGVSIATEEYRMKVFNLEQNNRMTGSAAYEQVWTNEVRSILLTEQFEKAGLLLGKDQLVHVIKSDPNFAQNPQFQNELGQFDINKFNAFLAQMQAAGPQEWNNWIAYEEELEKYAKEQMYYTMIKGAMITTAAEAKMAYKKEAEKVSFDYVTIPFNTINDEDVKVTDEEINAYVKKFPKQFKTTPSRQVEYVFIENKPSVEDEQFTKKILEDLLEPTIVFNQNTGVNDTLSGFSKATDLRTYVDMNSDVPFDSTYYAKEQLPSEHADQLYNLAPGAIYGPYRFNDYYAVSRLIAKKMHTESVDASHILIAYQDAMNADPTVTLSKEEAKEKADNILKQLQNGADFTTLASEHSTDPGSKNNGGKYENISQKQMVAPFDTYIFNNPVGKLGVVETDFGFHVLKVDKINEKEGIQLATIAKRIEASTTTEDQLFATASRFQQDVENNNEFSKIASEQNLIAHPIAKIGAFDDQLPGVGSHTEAIRWAYNKHTKVGDVRKFDTADGHLIIKLSAINDSDLMTATEARPNVESILINQKKANILREKMQGNTLDEVAKNASIGIINAIDVTAANPLVNGFQEPLVVGNAFGNDVDQVSKLIEGSNGMYMVQTKKITPAVSLPHYETYRQRVSTNNRHSVQSVVYNTIFNNAKIKDNRAKILQ